MGTDRSYIWCHQEPTRPIGTRQGIHDATSQWMCCGKWSALWTSYVIFKRVPAHERKSISWNLFIFGPMLIGTFLLILGWGIPRKSLWHRFWNTLYFNISHVIQQLCMQSATSVDHTSSAQLHTQFNFSAQHHSAVKSLSWINSKAGSSVLPYSNNKPVETAEKRCWVKMGILTGWETVQGLCEAAVGKDCLVGADV